jgi:hypothetical protein
MMPPKELPEITLKDRLIRCKLLVVPKNWQLSRVVSCYDPAKTVLKTLQWHSNSGDFEIAQNYLFTFIFFCPNIARDRID